MRARPLPLVFPLLVAACGGGDDPRPYAEALARHDPSGYSVEVTLHDPGCALGDVTVSAPSGAALTPLCVDGERSAGFGFGAFRPEDLPTFEWLVHETGEVVFANVECWQDAMPTPADVTSPATSPVTLRWASLGTGYEYLVTLVAGGSQGLSPEDAVTAILRDVHVTSMRLAPGPDLIAFRVMGGPAGWTTHAASSCYAVSEASAPFLVQQPR